ncbi:MAG: sensor domain-containing diguanylate cyclase [Lachnospiraceae bacterium]|nr:sensor domain-containing diguanylate cyclase [Lachnospiraceae bacterium]
MESERKGLSVKTKMYIFVVVMVLAVAFGTAAIAFKTSVNQIDRYYKQGAADNARNFASMVDGDYVVELREVVESEEYQQLRDRAEAEDDESLIEDYLKEKGLWDKYDEIRKMITAYLSNMQGVKYIYIVAHGDKDADYDMYLIDEEDIELYETGYYEEREKELRGIDLENLPEPTISNGDWGWLCSDFKPVYDSNGNCVCLVGCDFDMNDVMRERGKLLILLLLGAAIFTIIVLSGAVLFINKLVVKPLDSMTKEMKKFNPSEHASYEDAGVIDLNINSNDEIGEIYSGIQSMQRNIIDYLKDLSALQEDKIKASKDIKNKDKKIGQLSIEVNKDALTGVGSKTAYTKKIDKLNKMIKEEDAEFAFVMVDINNLKNINDDHGHKSGDLYIKGCCHMICEAFKRSPVYRIGGDEFVVILIGSDYENRKELCDNLMTAYEASYNQKKTEPWLRYSAAVGMAERIAEDMTAEPVFRRADKAMYENKAKIKKDHGKTE